MRLTLTLTNHNYGDNKDVQVNSEQKMVDTLHILSKAGCLFGMETDGWRVKSVRRGMYLNIYDTYENEQVYTGDILEIESIK